MMRPQWVALGIVLALVWSAVALAAESGVLLVLDGPGEYAGQAQRKVKGGCPGCGDE